MRREIEENVVDKSGLQATGCVALRKRVSFDTLYINNEILTKNHYVLWNWYKLAGKGSEESNARATPPSILHLPPSPSPAPHPPITFWGRLCHGPALPDVISRLSHCFAASSLHCRTADFCLPELYRNCLSIYLPLQRSAKKCKPDLQTLFEVCRCLAWQESEKPDLWDWQRTGWCLWLQLYGPCLRQNS